MSIDLTNDRHVCVIKIVSVFSSGYKSGGVVVYAMNLNNYNVSLTFPGLSQSHPSHYDMPHKDLSHSEDDMYVYLLEPENGDLKSR